MGSCQYRDEMLNIGCIFHIINGNALICAKNRAVLFLKIRKVESNQMLSTFQPIRLNLYTLNC